MNKTKQLIIVTDDMKAKEKTAIDCIHNGEYEKAFAVLRELKLLAEKAKELEAEIQREEMQANDVSELRSIQPARKSVQNMLESEVAKTIKFEKLLGGEMGAKSPYEMRNGNNGWREDESKTAVVVNVQKRERPENLVEIAKRNEVPKGTYTNSDTGIDIIFSRRSIEEIISKAIPDDKRDIPIEARMAALYQMKDLIENAVYFDSQISENNSKAKSPDTLFIHRMYCPFIYDNEQYLASLAVEEFYTKDKNDKFKDTLNRLYSFRDMEITPVKLLGFQTHASPQKADTDTSQGVITITIPQLFQFVKTYDTFFFENPESPGRTDREAEIELHKDFVEAVKTFSNEMGGGISEQHQSKGADFYETIKNMSEWADKVQEEAEKEKSISKINDDFSL